MKIVIASLLLVFFTSSVYGEGLIIQDVYRIIDISTQLARISEKVEFRNDGVEKVSSVTYIIEPYLKNSYSA